MAVAPTQGPGMSFEEQMQIQQQMQAQQRYEGTMSLMMQKQSETQSEGLKRLSTAQSNQHNTNSEIISNTRTK